MAIRRINIFGGPGAGKSTAASYVFSKLKQEGYNIELVTEYVKGWAWECREVKGFDQLYLFAKQLHREEVPLRSGADLIITDSPLLLSKVYSEGKTTNALMDIEEIFTNTYPELNVFLYREDTKPYNQAGRFQTLEQAKMIDEITLKQLREYKNNNYSTCGAIPEHVLYTVKKGLEGD